MILLMVVVERVLNIIRKLPLEKFNNDLVRHSIMSDETLPRILGDIATTFHGTQIWWLRWNLSSQGLLEMPITEMLMEGVPSSEH